MLRQNPEEPNLDDIVKRMPARLLRSRTTSTQMLAKAFALVAL